MVVASTAAVAVDAAKTERRERKQDNINDVRTDKNEMLNANRTENPGTMPSE